MGADGTRAVDTTIERHSRLLPTEVHIELVVHDDDAMEGLRVAAQRILEAAQRSRDPDVAEYLHRTYYCVCSAAAGYARLQALSLDNEIEAARAVPDLCRDWCFLIEGAGHTTPFPMLSALAPDGAFDELVEQEGQRLVDEEGALRFLLARDEINELEPDFAFDTSVQPSRIFSGLKSLLSRLRPVAWASRRSDGAGAGAAVPTST